MFKVIAAHFCSKEEATHRYSICNSCPDFNQTVKTCNLCGCFMVAKTKIKSSTCPANRWLPIPFNPKDTMTVPEDDEYYKNL